MDGHNAWLKQGMDEGVFMLAGSLADRTGGAIIAHGEAKDAIERRVAADPFVAEDVVAPRIIEISPAKAHDKLQFLLS